MDSEWANLLFTILKLQQHHQPILHRPKKAILAEIMRLHHYEDIERHSPVNNSPYLKKNSYARIMCPDIDGVNWRQRLIYPKVQSRYVSKVSLAKVETLSTECRYK